jgi:hypothetical protein
MDVPPEQFLDGLQFVQFATAAEKRIADAAADSEQESNGMAEAALHMQAAFSEIQHLAYLLSVTNQKKPLAGTASFQVC